MTYKGDFTTANTVYVYFDTFVASTGASVTMTGLAVTDVEIYKDGGTTQRASDAGITLLDTDGIDFDGITGIHGFKIDLSDDTDAGFYSAGSEYAVVVASVTVDSQTVNFVAAEFSIERAGGALALIKAGVTLANDSIKAGTFDESTAFPIPYALNITESGNVGINWASVENEGTEVDLSGTTVALGAPAEAYVVGYGNAGEEASRLGVLYSTLPASVTGDTSFVDANWNGTGDDFCKDYILYSVGSYRSYRVVSFADDTDTITVDRAMVANDEESPYILVPDGAAGGSGGASAADVWAYETRTLTALDEDDTTIDIDGTTIGTVTTVTNGVTLADDAITAGKFDESTAFPQTAADAESLVLP